MIFFTYEHILTHISFSIISIILEIYYSSVLLNGISMN